jgi:CDP-diacylglycerol---glycerol-3-phosphate 3-phosphatidyltransferase
VLLPNWLTWLRVACVPIFLLFFYLPGAFCEWATMWLFVGAGITDYLDGYIARRFRQSSNLGAFLDPVADKLMVVTALIALVGQHNLPYITLPAILIVCREVTISALREWMAMLGNRSLSVSWIGKIKTTSQMLAISTLLLARHDMDWKMIVGGVLLYIAAFLTLLSMLLYVRVARNCLRS